MRQLLAFLFRFSPGLVALALAASVLTGAANAALIALINRGISGTDPGSASLIWSFVAVCIALPFFRVLSDIVISVLAQKAIFDLRLHLSREILSAPLRQLEEVGASRLLATLTGDVMTLSNALGTVPYLAMNLAIFIFCVVYLAILFWPAALGVLLAAVLGVALFRWVNRKAERLFDLARQELDGLFEHFRALTGGIKELKLHRRRRRAFLGEILEPTATSFRRHYVAANAYYAGGASLGHIFFFVVVGVLVFWLPVQATGVSREILTGYTLVLLYLIVPMTALTAGMPALGLAVVALQKIESLGMSLANSTGAVPRSSAESSLESFAPVPSAPSEDAWSRLELCGVTHSYFVEKEGRAFTLGPIDWSLRPGELVFLIGGNGSGKTTLGKLLCGLYPPEAGEIRLDGQAVNEATRDLYRQSFTAIFSDFFLFERLPGLEPAGLEAKVQHYLEKLELDHKVELRGGELSTLDLSQGQRKRLALLTAYLEDRPIYLFDEWAADQDPAFKELFYYVLLPELKARGKTVIVISHDDHYYDAADRVIKLDYGRIESDRDLAPAAPDSTLTEALDTVEHPTVQSPSIQTVS